MTKKFLTGIFVVALSVMLASAAMAADADVKAKQKIKDGVVEVKLTCKGEVTALGYQADIGSAKVTAVDADNAAIKPKVGATGTIDFAWTEIPKSETFSFTVKGASDISSKVLFRDATNDGEIVLPVN
jgi:DNA/RNA endonuclease YhcR with UshA esterase domain